MALSREEVRFGVVPGLARLGEVLANAFARQRDLDTRLELERIRTGARSAQQAYGGPKATETRRTRNELEEALAQTREASAIPTREDFTPEGDPIQIPDLSAGIEVLGDQFAAPEGGDIEPLQRSLARLASLRDTSMQEGRAPLTAEDSSQLIDAISQGRIDPITAVNGMNLDDLVQMQHTLEASPGLGEQVQSLLVGGEQYRENMDPEQRREAERLAATARAAGFDPANLSLPQVAQAVDRGMAMAQQATIEQKIADMPPFQRVNFFAKQMNPNIRDISPSEIDVFRSVTTGVGGGFAEFGDQVRAADESIIEYANQLGYEGSDAIDASSVLVDAAQEGDQQARELLMQARAVDQAYAQGGSPVDVDQFYAQHVAEDPENRNPRTALEARGGVEAGRTWVREQLARAADEYGRISQAIARAKGATPTGSEAREAMGRIRGGPSDTRHYQRVRGQYLTAGRTGNEADFAGYVTELFGGAILPDEIDRIINADTEQLQALLYRMPPGERKAIAEARMMFGLTHAGPGNPKTRTAPESRGILTQPANVDPSGPMLPRPAPMTKEAELSGFGFLDRGGG